MKIYKALIMNDYEGAPYAEWIKTGEKTIETRMRSFNYRGDLVICCGKTNSVGKNAAKHYALLIYGKSVTCKAVMRKLPELNTGQALNHFFLKTGGTSAVILNLRRNVLPAPGKVFLI